MLNIVGLAVIAYLAAVVETAMTPIVDVHGVAPHLLMLVAAVWAAQVAASPWRLSQCAAIGLLHDVNSGGHSGLAMAGFVLVALPLIHWRHNFRRLGPIEQALILVPLLAGQNLFLVAGYRLFGQPMPTPSNLLVVIVGSAIYTSAVSLPVWMVIAWVRDTRRISGRLVGA